MTTPTIPAMANVEDFIIDTIDEHYPDEFHTDDCELVKGWENRQTEVERECSCSADNDIETALIKLGWHTPDCELGEERYRDEEDLPTCDCPYGSHGPARELAKSIRTEIVQPMYERIAELEKENANLRVLSDAVLGVVKALDSIKETPNPEETR
jgi:hypothetical protein